MKVLILTENVGGGHDACAKSIKDYLLSADNSNSCIISSAMIYTSANLAKAISDVHIFAYRFVPEATRLFFYIYSKISEKGSISEKSITYSTLTKGADKLYEFITNNDFDAVLCCHVLAALIVSKIKKNHPDFKPKVSFIATDFENDLSGTENNLDYYFIPDATLSEAFEKMGIPKEKIIESGIPVRAMFYSKTPKKQAKKELGLDPDCRHLLVMSGSMGAGSIEDVVIHLTSEKLPDKTEITVICGNNESLLKKLNSVCMNRDNFHIIGFVDNISLYMDSADLYVTKPGGLSTSEAAVKHLPMVLIDTVGGCETSNLYFYSHIGLAKTAKTKKKIASYCVELLGNPAILKKMSESMSKTKEELNSAKIIIDTIERSL